MSWIFWGIHILTSQLAFGLTVKVGRFIAEEPSAISQPRAIENQLHN
jgi:hypothetical protein